MKIILLTFLSIFFLCSELSKIEIFESVVVKKEKKNYLKDIKHIKDFAKKNTYNQEIAFMIDYSVHSGKNRFFVVNLKTDSIIYKALVCHGSCKDKQVNDNDFATEFSNKSGSLCTTLGMSLIAQRAYSTWGSNYKYWLDGLEEGNKNMRSRVVVLHSWEGVPDEEIYPKPLALSWGCPTVSIDFLATLDGVLKENKKVLLYSFK